MAPLRRSASPSSESDSGTDAPVAIPHTQARRAARTREAAQEQVVAGEREKQKEKNRERDRRLKFRAGKRVETAVGVEEDVELRMERAMREAQEESGEDEDEDEDSKMSAKQDSDDEQDDQHDSDDAESDDEDEEMPANPNHLPDHLFASAFAAPAAPSLSKISPGVERTKRKPTRTPKAKELVVGSRTIRIASTAPRAIPATIPSRKVRKFTDRALALALNGSAASNKKPWKRVPANLGVMRRSLPGPPVGFVRNP
ncbi:hypothetical protein C8F04DRAFT_1094225 [Mycena alexandri]|uniref:Uncharacterized protein n=1 Tax=Mycena alexandri TaxID=1745969 RepID=A0AAD6X966_9AGAR|nr:hypothetical protein C8F04DRAFT_1094225 [Mycena alexandri]